MPAYIQDAGYFLRNPQGPRRRVYDENGKARYERTPPTVANRYGVSRAVKLLRDDGHVVHATLTSAASNIDLECPQANYYRRKWRNLGWLEVGKCPVASAVSGLIHRRVLCKENKTAVEQGDACQHGAFSEDKPCRHLLAEEAARKARRREEHAAKERQHRPEADKIMEAQSKTQEATAGAVERMAQILEQVVAKQADPEPTKKGRGGSA